MSANSNQGSIVSSQDWWKALPRKIYSELQRVDTEQSWFEVYKIAPHVFAFYEPGQFEEVISYLVVGRDRAALVDTGMGIGELKKLVEEFTRLPLMVVNTHSHYDHIAQNYLFENVAIFDAPSARQAAKNGCSSEVMLPLLEKGLVWKSLPVDFDSAHYHVPPFTVTRWLNDSDLNDLGDRRLEVIHTPGHSPDSICLLDRDARLLWTGDTYYPGPICLHLPGSDLDEFIESYEKLLTLSEHYNMLIPSHNEPYVSKGELSKVLNAAKDVRSGNAEYVERTENGTKIRRHDYPGFAIITNASAIEVNGV